MRPNLASPLLSSIRALLGGRVRAIMSGGAPLSPATHDYLRAVLGVDLLQVRNKGVTVSQDSVSRRATA